MIFVLDVGYLSIDIYTIKEAFLYTLYWTNIFLTEYRLNII